MANTFGASRDGNGIPTFMVTRNDDGIFPMTPYVNPTTGHVRMENGTTGNPALVDWADRDVNGYPVWVAVSAADFKTPVVVQGDFTNGSILIDAN